MTDTPERVESAESFAQRLWGDWNGSPPPHFVDLIEQDRAAVRRQAIEHAARVCDLAPWRYGSLDICYGDDAEHAARAIRSLAKSGGSP